MPILMGMNSGTSADGIDAVVVRFEGDMPSLPLEILASVHRPYPPFEKQILERLLRDGHGTLEEICHLNFALGHEFMRAAIDAEQAAGINAGNDVAVIGCHGQTLYHLPPHAAEGRKWAVSTWQIGEAAIVARWLGCPVASDFRVANIAAGGQGAPLTAILDQLLFMDAEKVRLRLNIGGIGNVTYLRKAKCHEQAVGFDTGPGNTLIDQAVTRISNGAEAYDSEGARAARGHVNQVLLNELFADSYFHLPPPKTTGRELFGPAFVELAMKRAKELGLSDDDLVATLTELTVKSILDAVASHLPTKWPIVEVIVHGGGAKNPVMMRRLQEGLGAGVRLTTVEEFGIPLQALEPILFALLGWLCLNRVPSGIPGQGSKTILGKMTFPPKFAAEVSP